MLQQFIHTVLVSIICIIWGIPVLLVSRSTIGKDNFWFRSMPSFLSFLFFSGCISLGIISSWLCLLAPLRFIYLLALTFMLLLYLLSLHLKRVIELFIEIKRLKPATGLIEYLYIALCAILFIALGSMKPINFDTQIYHLQIIQWQAAYGAVPGVANLFPRIGQGSNWFNLIAFFHIPFLKHENFSYVNISFVFWFFVWLFSNWKYHISMKQDQPGNRIAAFFYFFLFIFCMYDWQLYRDAANSTNYDFQVTAFIIITISYFFEEILEKQPRNYFSPTLTLFALAIVSFKFSGIFILLLLLYYLIIVRSGKAWLKTMIMGLIILLPVLIKNYIITGYPLFPQPFSIGSPDWQLPKGLADGNYWYILNYNRFFNYWFMIGKVGNAAFNWVPFWIKGIQPQHKVVLCLALSSAMLLFIKPPHIINQKRLRHLVVILLLMIAGWFLTAPDPGRFGYGPLLCATSIIISLLAGRFLNIRIYKSIFFILIIIIGVYGFRKTKPLFKDPQYLVYPMSTEKPTYKTFYVKGIGINLPDIINENWDHRLYNSPLPSTGEPNPYLEPRGSTLREGFRMSPYPDSNFIKNYTY